MSSNWYWNSDYGRDQILRSEIEAQAAASARSAARLRSQLTRVQGSMERRLTALAEAFDAYVELGDVREELAAMPSSTSVRRRARDAMATLKAGGTPPPLPEGQAGHWLGGAMNRVIAVVRGQVPAAALAATATDEDQDAPHGVLAPDRAAGDQTDPEQAPRPFTTSAGAVMANPEARIFEVLALAALDHGADGAESLPMLLTTDGGFTAEQRVIFDAVVDGHYGPGAVALIGDAMRSNLARSNPRGWRDWLLRQSGAGDVRVLRWVEYHTAPVVQLSAATEGATPIDVAGYNPVSATETDTAVDTLAAVQDLVDRIVDEGSPLERDLMHRAGVLRAKIEKPDVVIDPPRWERESQPVDESVRDAFARLEPGNPAHAEVLSWLLPHLRPTIEESLVERAQAASTVTVRTPGGSVTVNSAGADPDEVRLARERIEQRYAPEPWSKGLLIATGVLVVASIVGCILLGGPQWWLLLTLPVAAFLGGRAVWLHRPGDREMLVSRDLAEIETGVERAHKRLVTTEQNAQEAKLEHDQLVATVRERLEATGETAGQQPVTQ